MAKHIRFPVRIWDRPMKIAGMEFECPTCGKWSDDNEVCSHCGAQIPSDDSLAGVFVPGLDDLSEEAKSVAIQKAAAAQARWTAQLRHDQELRSSDPGIPDDDRTRPWRPTHMIRGLDSQGGTSTLMVLPNGQAFTEEAWRAFVASSLRRALFFKTSWTYWQGRWFFNAEPLSEDVAVDPLEPNGA